MIQSLKGQFPIKALCQALQLSSSGYYQWLGQGTSPRSEANRALVQHIKSTFEQSRQTYGSPRITRQLKGRNIPCSENRVARLMQAQGIRARQKRPFRPRTTDSRHGLAPAPNWLKAMPTPTRVNQAWVADITYIHTATGWVYLAAVMDLCSRKIVGWSISQSLESSLVKEALKQALAFRRPAPGLLHHSDRGVQYASSAFQALLQSQHLCPSMSGRGNCYDNAAMESFWSTLKSELIHHLDLQDLAHARLVIFDYIETFYNRVRLHSALGYKSPVDFELHLTYNKN